MARRKEIQEVKWTGTVIQEPRNVVLVLTPKDDPERTLLLTVANTPGRRLRRHLEDLDNRVDHHDE